MISAFRAPRAITLLVSLCLATSSLALRAADAAPKAGTPRTSVKLLTVGNSFADNASSFLPDMAKAGGKELVLFRANLGGHSLEQHVGYLEAFEANPSDPKGHAYKKKVDPVTGEKKDFSLREALENQKWDVVTIQQVSNKSFKYETFQPYANTLIAYIRKYAPQAEILIYETWAYREDHRMFKDGSLNQQSMYEGLRASYGKLSEETGLRIIPVGDAFQAARALPQWHFTPSSNVEAAVAPVETPAEEAAATPGKGAEAGLNVKDAQHANAAGRYLAGAVFYEMIFRDSVEANSFVPKTLSPEDAKTLREIAHTTVAKAKK